MAYKRSRVKSAISDEEKHLPRKMALANDRFKIFKNLKDEDKEAVFGKMKKSIKKDGADLRELVTDIENYKKEMKPKDADDEKNMCLTIICYSGKPNCLSIDGEFVGKKVYPMQAALLLKICGEQCFAKNNDRHDVMDILPRELIGQWKEKISKIEETRKEELIEKLFLLYNENCRKNKKFFT